MKNIVLAAVTDKKSNKILFQKRQTKDFLEGFWELPGGKVESGETKQDSILRELREELDEDVFSSLELNGIQEVGSQQFDYVEKNLKLNFTLFQIPSSMGVTLGAELGYLWVDPEELYEGSFQEKIPPATVDIFLNLRNRLSL